MGTRARQRNEIRKSIERQVHLGRRAAELVAADVRLEVIRQQARLEQPLASKAMPATNDASLALSMDLFLSLLFLTLVETKSYRRALYQRPARASIGAWAARAAYRPSAYRPIGLEGA